MNISPCCGPSNSDPAIRRHQVIIGGSLAIYVALVILISWVTPISAQPDVIRIPAALSPVLPILVTLWAIGRATELQKDEFRRMVEARGMLIATGLLLAFATGWGFLQEYAELGSFPAIIAFPLWCAARPLGTFLAARRYR